ncbi:MAG: hypothetical protein LBQ71_20150, partial [Hungatella sp.]|nr:hypothetical protein [Hungatella sp.]
NLMFLVNSEFYLNDDLEFCPVSVDNYPQKRKNHLTITYYSFVYKFVVGTCPVSHCSLLS